MFCIEIKQSDPDMESNYVWFYEKDKADYVGFGFQGKKTKRIYIERCPKCGKENYALAKATGYCAFCGFTANT